MSEVYVLFGASVAVMLLAIVTFFVVVNYHKTLKKQRELEEEVKRLRAEGSEEARKIILNAQVQATEVIKGAQLKAQELIQASEIFSGEYKQNFQVTFERETNKMLSNMSQSINAQVNAEVGQLHSTFAKNMAQALAQAQSQVEEYKKVMLDRVNSAALIIVQSIAKKVLKEGLDQEKEKKLILKALEEAKRENVL